jgi:phospholipid/cholesterol/gamma-HCH transport system substrate-binding protein
MSNEKNDWWVGLFVLLGAVALAFLALRAGNLSTFSFAPTYKLSAKFDNIGGLKVRAPVKSAGVVVGRVADISLDGKTYQAIVTLQMEKNFAFPTDSSAKILTSGLLGEQYIGIEPGGEDANLENGNTIHMTQSAIVLESLISHFLYGTAEKQGTPASGSASGSASAPASGSTAGPAAGPAATAASAPESVSVTKSDSAEAQAHPSDNAPVAPALAPTQSTTPETPVVIPAAKP